MTDANAERSPTAPGGPPPPGGAAGWPAPPASADWVGAPRSAPGQTPPSGPIRGSDGWSAVGAGWDTTPPGAAGSGAGSAPPGPPPEGWGQGGSGPGWYGPSPVWTPDAPAWGAGPGPQGGAPSPYPISAPRPPRRRGMRAAILVVVIALLGAAAGLVTAELAGGGSSHAAPASTSRPTPSGSASTAPGTTPGSPTTGGGGAPTSTTIPSPLAPTLAYVYGTVGQSSSVNGRTYQLLATAQTSKCGTVASARMAKVLASQHCISVLRGLFVDEQADIIIAEDVVVCPDSAEGGAVSQALNGDNEILGITSLSVPVSAVHPYADTKNATAQLPASPAGLPKAGPAKIGTPDRSPGGTIYGSTTVSNLVTFNATAYADGREAETSDARLQRAGGDVRYIVADALEAITFSM